jgi:hypothetical protein
MTLIPEKSNENILFNTALQLLNVVATDKIRCYVNKVNSYTECRAVRMFHVGNHQRILIKSSTVRLY